jgi:folate-binding protein YgfZ
MPADSPGAALIIGPADLSSADADAALEGAVVARADVATLDVAGPAARQCIQGIHTNDVETVGPGGFVYGATLTPKGMIVSDLWVARHNGDCTLYAPVAGKEAVLATFGRYVPPRLAGITDRANDVTVLHLVGPQALELAQQAGIELPQPGRTSTGMLQGASYRAAAPSRGIPFGLQLAAANADADTVLHALEGAGVATGAAAALELARILTGWPRLGAEIGEKTLPQEVRFDEIGGVSHSKGCYTGQETVARLHFRGHANWRLAGLRWDVEPTFETAAVEADDKTLGRVSSAVWLPRRGSYVGLAVVRHEVAADREVTAAGAAAHTVALPLSDT